MFFSKAKAGMISSAIFFLAMYMVINLLSSDQDEILSETTKNLASLSAHAGIVLAI